MPRLLARQLESRIDVACGVALGTAVEGRLEGFGGRVPVMWVALLHSPRTLTGHAHLPLHGGAEETGFGGRVGLVVPAVVLLLSLQLELRKEETCQGKPCTRIGDVKFG